ncbi:PD-(D/E)XK nuclease family protein [Nocardiopsis halotolerans]|uniref:PD-(D/E)XK nuclease family protein n=1 Tax=Nocardiopsis halotolerans TaxID=124252 RepID=UPI000344D656|nr:PD-(D/E)XK nuclease family protein [Nocardiopsis halotolerans]
MPYHDMGDHASVPVVRVFGDSAALSRGGCPAHRRIRADLSTGGNDDGRPPLCDTPLAPLNAVLDLVEHGGWTVGDACAHLPVPGGRPRDVLGESVAPPHAGLLSWVRHASRCYLDALARDDGRDGLHRAPAFDFWVRQYVPGPASPHSRPYELCVRGRGYTYVEGADRVRELRVPVMGVAGARERPRAEVAVAAYVLATGTRVDRDAYAERPSRYLRGVPYPMRGRSDGAASRPPDRVRVVEVSCLDSSTAVLHDGSASGAEESFAAAGREGLRSALVGGARSPGRDCLACAARSGCGRLPRVPGLLGLADGSRPRRSWSVSVGLRHRGCPARAHFHSLGLAADPRGTPASACDRAVRAWLERLHTRLPRRPCAPEDLPGEPASWSAGGRRLEGGQARRGAAMIAAHVGVCPLRGLVSGSHVRVGHTLAADDTRANVLVLARAEVLHHRGRSWVHRTVTTDAGALDGTEDDLLEHDPRLALAVGFLASGALSRGPESAVELEVLTPGGASVRSLDPGSARVRAGARRVVRGLAEPWHGDLSHPPRPGEACRDCPYRRWCPAADGSGDDAPRQSVGSSSEGHR